MSGHASEGGGELVDMTADQEEEFDTPLSSPTGTTSPKEIQDKLSLANKTVTVGLSNASASGGSNDQKEVKHTNGSSVDVSQKNDLQGDRKIRVMFRDEDLTETFDDSDLWTRDPDETSHDMIMAYQKECINMKVKPIQILLDQLKGVYNLNTPIDTIDLTGVKLDSKTCEVLEAVLSRVTSHTLKLERTNLEDEGVIAIFEMVEFYGCASRLLLAHNNKLRPRAWLTIGRTLKKSPFITTIDVSYCALDEQTLTLLLRAVRANCGLKVLKMEGNNLTGKGTFILMAAMKFNENLEELYLSRNHLAPEDGQHLGNILRSNHTLRVLDVSDNNLQDSGVRYISAGIAEQQEGLHVLNVSTNNLTQDGIHHISAMLPCTKSLRELNISNNRFGDPGLFMLKLGVLANRSVEKLLLSGTKITCEGAIALAEVLAESKYLMHVDLRENEIRVAGLMALCLALRMNHHLLHLETPKTFKVEQRDRQLIKDLLAEMDKHRSRNHKEKEERDKEEARRLHEETHANSSVGDEESSSSSGATKPDKKQMEEEEEEEKEVDPSLVGSLDNVYTEETEAEMMKEDDPFKKAPVLDKDSMGSAYEIEETANALVAYTSESIQEDCTSPLPEDEENELSGLSNQGPSPSGGQENLVDLLTSPNDNPVGDNTPVLSPGHTESLELLPDVIGGFSGQSDTEAPNPSNHIKPPPSHSLPPDVAPHGTLPPDLAADSQHPVDLLNPADSNISGSEGEELLDLTDGTSHDNSPDVTHQ